MTPLTLSAAADAVRTAQPGATRLQIIDALRAVPAPAYLEVPPRFLDVTTRDVQVILLRGNPDPKAPNEEKIGDWGKIILASENTSLPDGLRVVLINTVTYLGGDPRPIDFGDPAVYGAFFAGMQVLQSAGLVSSWSVSELLAFISRPQSWAEHTGIDPSTLPQK